MADGSWKPIGQLSIGEMVASIDGQPSAVYGVYPQGEVDLVRITFVDGRSVVCSKDHLWKVYFRKWDEDSILDTAEIQELLDLKQYDKRLSIPTIGGDFGQTNPNLPLDPWMLGALLGNGAFTSGNCNFSSGDSETVDKLRTATAKRGWEVKFVSRYDYRINGGLKQVLRDMGLDGKYSYEKSIPTEYLTSDSNQRLALLQGLMDTDGTVGSRNQISYCTTSPQLRDDVVYLARSFGAICSVQVKHPKGGREAYNIGIRHSNPEQFFSLKRKQERCRPLIKIPRLTITKVEEVGRGEAVCIAVTHPSKLFVTRDFIVTHNTTLGATLHQASIAQLGKPGLVIAVEASDGGGTSSIQDFDVPYVQPSTFQELDKLISTLSTDTTFGAVILDNATDMVSRIVKPHALTFPTRGAPPPTRSIGVPCRDDYQIMGELVRKTFNGLINLTKLPNAAARKHLLVTVLEKEKQDDGVITAYCPDLPGQMAETASAMFELYAGIKIANQVKPDPNNPKATIKEQVRLLTCKGDGRKQLGDRYKVFPEEGPLDFVQLFEKYWLPKVAATSASQQ